MKYINLLLLCFLIGSNGKIYKIPKEDYSLIPYKGNEVLVFKSNSEEADTIFLQGTKNFSSPINQWDNNPDYAEHYKVVSKRSDPKYDRYLDSLNFITIINGGETKIEFDFTAKKAWFYGDLSFTKSQFLKIKETRLTIGATIYNDVLILTTNRTISNRKSGVDVIRPNTVLKLYWSRKAGIVRYDKLNGEFWELINIYNK